MPDPRSALASTAALFLLASLATAADPPADTKTYARISDADRHAPTPIPDRIVLTWEADPATSMSVTWRTSVAVTAPVVQLFEATAGAIAEQKAVSQPAGSETLETDLGPSRYHSVTFTGLKPATQYVCRVGDGFNWSEWMQFRTADSRTAPFTFLYLGDAQNQIRSQWTRVVRAAQKACPEAAFAIHAGDLIDHAEADAEWGDWHIGLGSLHREIPCVPTPGNHECVATSGIAGLALKSRLGRYWRPMFTLPTNGPKGLEETAYWFDYQGVRFISLNSNEQFFPQAKWLKDVLSNRPQKWTIITFHHPMYAAVEGRDDLVLRAAWQPVFDQFGVDLVLQGHDHVYMRTGLMTGPRKEAASPSAGTLFVTSVAGPKMYAVQKRPFIHRAADNTMLFQTISIDGDALTFRARTVTGELYDGFTLKKRNGQPNELIDEIPMTPDRIGGPTSDPIKKP